MRWVAILSFAVLAGCVTTTEAPAPSASPQQPVAKAPSNGQVSRFKQVVTRVEPVAERYCRQQAPG